MVLEHVNTVTKRNKAGKVTRYYYHRKTRRRIFGEPGTPEFIVSYNQAAEVPADVPANTLSALIEKYRTSESFLSLSEKSRQDYSIHLGKISAALGSIPVNLLGDYRIRTDFYEWRDTVAKTSKRQADYGIAVLKLVLQWSYNRGKISANHASRIETLYKSNRSHIIWLPEDIELFCGPGCSQVLKFACLFASMSGLRLSDLVAIPLSANKGTHMEWTTSKSRGRFEVIIPIYHEMSVLLESMAQYRKKHDVSATTILFNERGLPYTTSGFSASFRKRKDKVGIGTRLHLHDLRGTAATKLYNAGLSPGEVADILGWSAEEVQAIIKKYVHRENIVSGIVKRIERGSG